MNILISYTIIQFISSCLSVPTNTNSLHEPINSLKNQEDMVIQKIKELEQQKNELFIEINKAIEESVAVLKNSNLTNAKQGVSYIENLKQQIKNVANTNDSREHYHDRNSDESGVNKPYNERNSIDARRHSGKHKHRAFINKHNSRMRAVDKDAARAKWEHATVARPADQMFLIKAEKDLDK